MKLILSLLLFAALAVSAQDVTVVDSLKKALVKTEGVKSSTSDSSKAELLYQLSREYWSSNLDTAMMYAEQLLNFSKQTGNKRGTGNAYSSIGVIWWYRSDYEKALDFNELALKTRQETGDKKSIAGSYINIGLVYDEQGYFDEALKNYLESLKLNEQIGDSDKIAQCYNLIAIIYETQNNYPEALKNFEKSLDIRLKSGNKWDLSESYSNIGIVYFENKDYKEAVKNYDQALKLRLEIGDRAGIANSYNNYGDVYIKEKKFDEALASFRKALDIYTEMGLKKNMSNVLLNIAGTYMDMGSMKDAVEHAKSSLALSREIGALDYQRNAYQLLSTAAARLNNYKDALEYERNFRQLNDSLYSSEKMKAVAKLHLQYEFDKKHLADSLNFAQQKQLTQVKLSRQRAFTIGGFAGLVVVAVLLFFAYRSYQRQKKTNRLLVDTQEQLVQSEKLASLGELATGVAREIETPVSYMKNFSDLSKELLQEWKDEKDEKAKSKILSDLSLNLDKISFHGHRADSIVKSMLRQVRFGKGEKQLSDLNKICNEFADVAYRTTLCSLPGLKAQVIKNFDPAMPRLKMIRPGHVQGRDEHHEQCPVCCKGQSRWTCGDQHRI